jgi:hypothetical protein
MLHIPLISWSWFDDFFCINSVLVFILATRITYKLEHWRRRRWKEEKQREKRRTKHRKKESENKREKET